MITVGWVVIMAIAFIFTGLDSKHRIDEKHDKQND